MESTQSRIVAWMVHAYTAIGIVVALRTLSSGLQGDYRTAFAWMIVAVLIDATDGPIARRALVWQVLPQIDGRKLDDIADYANYTFVPLAILAQSGWLPNPGWLWAGIAMVASMFTFAHTGSKDENCGFFRGFPSYWNIVVFYVAICLSQFGPYFVLATVLALSLLSVVPVWFVYPNKARKWRRCFLVGGYCWLVLLVGLLWQYPDTNRLLVALSFVYPAFYVAASWHLARESRPGMSLAHGEREPTES